VAREPAVPKHLNQLANAKLLIRNNKRPTIPAFVLPAVKKLTRKCWKRDPSRRSTSHQILNQLEAMKFKLAANVNSSKLSEFVKKVKDWEKTNDIPIVRLHSTLHQSVSKWMIMDQKGCFNCVTKKLHERLSAARGSTNPFA
jgi:hypothetical protein